MITRTAVFEGRFKAGDEARFFAGVEERLAPVWREFPHALAVRWFRMEGVEADAHPIVMIQQIDYPSRETLAAAIDSPVRDRARAITMELMELLDGRFYHFISEGGAR